MSDLRIREATREDLPDILRLLAQPEMDDGTVLSLAEAERLFERMACYPDYRLHVATRDEKIVGSFALLIMDNLGHRGAPSGVVEDVMVDPACQGQGIGRAMMRHALALCGEKGCYKVALSSNLARERAHAFYESLGFERHGYSFRITPPAPLADDSARARLKRDASISKGFDMSTLPSCPQCGSEYTYEDGANYVCPECAHEWPQAAAAESTEQARVVRDANGTELHDGDTVTVVKDLKVKGSSLVVKVGTKVKNIRLVEGDHDIDCKIDGIGAMGLKSEFVKKV
jgi:alkylphosphonate utilization operon protein PhnA